MGGFQISDSDGNVIREIWSCTECTYVSTKRHFHNDDDIRCPLCHSIAQQSSTLTQSKSMSDFQYRRILNWLQEEKSGIGDAIISNIRDEFPEGDDFVDTCKHAYEEAEYDELTAIGGVGESTARKKLANGLAEYKDWSGGKAEVIEFDPE